MCDDETLFDKFDGHVLASFDQLRDTAGCDPSVTSKTWAYPNGKWRILQIQKALTKAKRRLPLRLRFDEGKLVADLEEYLQLNVDLLKVQYDTTDLEEWAERLKWYAMGETDKDRASGFIC